MNNKSTELVFILDRSGSMSGMESDTIGGFNSMIEKQKRLEGDCLVTTILFNSAMDMIHDRCALNEIKPMTNKDYCVGGSTALLDALGSAIHHISQIHKYARPADIPEVTTFVIMTDGMENASRKYSYEQVKQMIEQSRERGWEFLFLAADIDAVETAGHIGINPERAVDYLKDHVGTELAFQAIDKTVGAMRRGCGVKATWSKSIADDFKKRR